MMEKRENKVILTINGSSHEIVNEEILCTSCNNWIKFIEWKLKIKQGMVSYTCKCGYKNKEKECI